MSTLTRADLADAINRKMGLSRAESLTLVESILDRMSDALAGGANVKISDCPVSAAAPNTSSHIGSRRATNAGLPNGNTLVGWGRAGRISEFAPDGTLLFDAHAPVTSSSRAGWSG